MEKEKLLREEYEKQKKEKEKLKEELLKAEILEKERKEKERLEKEKEENERLERERLEKEKEEKERKEKEKLEIEALKKELEEKKKKEKEWKKKKEEEERQKQKAIDFPNGITYKNSKINDEIKFIHLDIKFKNEIKDIEIFDIYSPSKQGYKVVNFEKNKYVMVFPFYKSKPNNEKLSFGIREVKTQTFVEGNEIELKPNYLEYINKPKKHYELRIIKEKSEYMTFNIYNKPKDKNKIQYLKLINKLNLKDYRFKTTCINDVTKLLNYKEIIDLIMEIGNNQISEKLIGILNDRKIEIQVIDS